MSRPVRDAVLQLVQGARDRLESTPGKVEYAVILLLVGMAAVLALLVVHHSAPGVLSNIGYGLGP
jgi:hypothetical protein